MIALLLAAALIAPDVTPRIGWMREGSSLLYIDGTGSITVELPLRSEEEPLAGGSRVNIHQLLGGASANGRFGWTLERTTTWNQSRTKTFGSRRLLRLYGSDGKELWSSSEAEKPPTGNPIVFSTNGEILIVSLRTAGGWTASIKGFLGNTILDVGPVPSLETMALTANGRYAMVRWTVPDQSGTHTLVDIPSQTRKDLPSSDLYMGPARIDEDGKVYSGKKLVFDLAKARKS